ncbi:Herc2 [Symbiodinium sp. KB8]|nr:Herc2 [Symbiodinium sp. KB8]
MSITVEVGLLSGRTATLRASLEEDVGSLTSRAQTALGIGRSRLVDSSGGVLDGCARIKNSRLQSGDTLTLHVGRVQVQATRHGFAAVRGDGSVVTWGDPRSGGDSSAVQHNLKNVQQIQASQRAFAAVLDHGSVVTWGNVGCGGDSTAVQHQLKNVQQIQASQSGFAAVLEDGSVVAWGYPRSGGDSSAVQHQLKDVEQIQASAGAFAAILGNGSVVTWGDPRSGGDSSAVQNQLKNVRQIQASTDGFAAILGDGSVVSWGRSDYFGDCGAELDQLKNAQQVQACAGGAFAAVLGNEGSVVSWGEPGSGGNSSAAKDHLKCVQQVQASTYAFAAVLCDGSVVTWGHGCFGGDSSAVQHRLKDVQQIQAAHGAFAAILGDGSVVTWGDSRSGGDTVAVQDQLKNVRQIQASSAAFAAILGDRSVVTWGDPRSGGDSSAVQHQLKHVQQIQASSKAFAAVLNDGSLVSVVTWGHPGSGGDSSAVWDLLKVEDSDELANLSRIGDQVEQGPQTKSKRRQSPRGSALALQWTPPSPSPSPLQFYELEYDDGYGPNWTSSLILPAAYTSYELTGPTGCLVPGGRYRVRLRVATLEGWSPWSPEAGFFACEPPGPPSGLESAWNAGGLRPYLTWSAPEDLGGGFGAQDHLRIVGYVLWLQLPQAPPQRIAEVPGEQTQMEVDLPDVFSSQFLFSVNARNQEFDGNRSAALDLATSGPPGAPGAPELDNVSETGVYLFWAPPTLRELNCNGALPTCQALQAQFARQASEASAYELYWDAGSGSLPDQLLYSGSLPMAEIAALPLAAPSDLMLMDLPMVSCNFWYEIQVLNVALQTSFSLTSGLAEIDITELDPLELYDTCRPWGPTAPYIVNYDAATTEVTVGWSSHPNATWQPFTHSFRVLAAPSADAEFFEVASVSVNARPVYFKLVAVDSSGTWSLGFDSATARLLCVARPLAPPKPVLSLLRSGRRDMTGIFGATVDLTLAGQTPETMALHSGWQLQLTRLDVSEVPETTIITDTSITSYTFPDLPPSTPISVEYAVISLAGTGDLYTQANTAAPKPVLQVDWSTNELVSLSWTWSPGIDNDEPMGCTADTSGFHVFADWRDGTNYFDPLQPTFGYIPVNTYVVPETPVAPQLVVLFTVVYSQTKSSNTSPEAGERLKLRLSARLLGEVGESPMSPFLTFDKLALPPLPPRLSIRSSTDTQVVVEWSLDRSKERGAYHTGYYFYVSVDGTTWPNEDTGYVATWQDEQTTEWPRGVLQDEAPVEPQDHVRSALHSHLTALFVAAVGATESVVWEEPADLHEAVLLGYKVYVDDGNSLDTKDIFYLAEVIDDPARRVFRQDHIVPSRAYKQRGRYKVTAITEVGEGDAAVESLVPSSTPRAAPVASVLDDCTIPWWTSKALCPYPQRYRLTVASVDVREDADITSPLFPFVTVTQGTILEVTEERLGADGRMYLSIPSYGGWLYDDTPLNPGSPLAERLPSLKAQWTWPDEEEKAIGGSPITAWRVYRSTDGIIWSDNFTAELSATARNVSIPCEVSEITVPFWLRVTAVNNVGEGPPSNAAALRCSLPPGLQPAPIQVGSDITSILLEFQPADLHNATYAHYTDGVHLEEKSVHVTGLRAWHTYTFKVQAITESGISPDPDWQVNMSTGWP